MEAIVEYVFWSIASFSPRQGRIYLSFDPHFPETQEYMQIKTKILIKLKGTGASCSDKQLLFSAYFLPGARRL
jgi:hypothetical protein